MPTITIAGRDISYTVSYKNRKTIQLKIIGADRLAVSAPPNTSLAELDRMIRTKASWIAKKMLHYRQLAANPVNASWQHGAALLFMGKPYTISIHPAARHSRVELSEDVITVTTAGNTAAAVPGLLKAWYVNQAAALLPGRTAEWSGKLGVQPNRIVIKEQQTRWGSCSSLGNINYNWRIIMAPASVIDYLVVHELCHLRVPNHSADFWRLVGACLPDFKERRNWLKQNGALLSRPL